MKLELVPDAASVTVGIDQRVSMNIAISAIRWAIRHNCARRGIACGLDPSTIDAEADAAEQVLLAIMSGTDAAPSTNLDVRAVFELCARICRGEKGSQ